MVDGRWKPWCGKSGGMGYEMNMMFGLLSLVMLVFSLLPWSFLRRCERTDVDDIHDTPFSERCFMQHTLTTLMFPPPFFGFLFTFGGFSHLKLLVTFGRNGR